MTAPHAKLSIAAAIAVHLDKIADLEGQIGIERASIRRLQGMCKHPNIHKTRDYSGETGTYCPDCGETT